MRTVLIVAALAAIAGCSTAPSITRQKMTLGEADISGMECRRAPPTGSNMKQTVCASPEAWAEYDKKREFENKQIFETDRVKTGVGPFGRQ
jgi:hypothetical protein